MGICDSIEDKNENYLNFVQNYRINQVELKNSELKDIDKNIIEVSPSI